jgi:hypothetical protein
LTIGLAILVISVKRLLLTKFYIDFSGTKYKGINILNSDFELRNYKTKLLWNYILLEIKLIFRNNRPIQTLSIYPFFPLYLIFQFVVNDNISIFSAVYMLAFIFGLFSLLYGQYVFSWESSYFDGILARKDDMLEYIYSKYCCMFLSSILIFLIILAPFLIIKKVPFLVLISMFFFENGISNLIILYVASFNKRRIDLQDNFLFNYQGLGGHQFILPVLILLLPLALFIILNIFIFRALISYSS